jgi:hypothetical protein
MATSIRSNHFKAVLVFMTLIFLFCGAASAFSQEILVTFNMGGIFLNDGESAHIDSPLWNEGATIVGADILFVGKYGFAVSTGTDIDFKVEVGGGIMPVLGFGYVYYNVFYLGGMLNYLFNFDMALSYPNGNIGYGDGFIAPTLVAGFDFRAFVLQAQFSYPIGVVTGISGPRFLIGAGVNVGKGW